MNSSRLLTAFVAACGLLAASAGAQDSTAASGAAGRACAVEGAWDLVSLTANGKAESMDGWRQRKLVAHGQHMWIAQAEKRDTLPLRTAADSLRRFMIGGGGGAYSVSGDTYTEQLEFFFDPQLVGRSVTAKCRIEGDHWYHDFEIVANGQTTRTSEVWRRVR